MDYVERLRRLAGNMPGSSETDIELMLLSSRLDPKTLALARLAALIAVGAAEPSFGEHVDAALSAGATADEMVDILTSLGPVVGVPRTVAAAPTLALALGHDLESDD